MNFTIIYRNLLQEYVHFFGGCKIFANKTGWYTNKKCVYMYNK